MKEEDEDAPRRTRHEEWTTSGACPAERVDTLVACRDILRPSAASEVESCMCAQKKTCSDGHVQIALECRGSSRLQDHSTIGWETCTVDRETNCDIHA